MLREEGYQFYAFSVSFLYVGTIIENSVKFMEQNPFRYISDSSND